MVCQNRSRYKDSVLILVLLGCGLLVIMLPLHVPTRDVLILVLLGCGLLDMSNRIYKYTKIVLILVLLGCGLLEIKVLTLCPILD